MAEESVKIPAEVSYTPAPAIIEANNAPFKAFWLSYDAAAVNDIVLISSHGRYEFPLDSDAAAALSYIVPENTYVIETLDVGRLCATTIDKPLWNLLQPTNRAKFLALLKEKEVSIESENLKGIINYSNRVVKPEEYLLVLKNFIIYLPGMSVPKRRLLFAGDTFYKGPKVHYKLTYRGFGVYHFPKNSTNAAPFPKARNVQGQAHGEHVALRNIENFFLKDADKDKNLFKRMVRSADFVTNEDVINHIVTDKMPRIILFSSCGEYYTPTDATRRTNAMKAIQMQREAIYKTRNAGYTQFLFRNPIACNSAPETYLNYVLENGTDPVAKKDKKPAIKNFSKRTTENAKYMANYRKLFFQGKEEYEGKLMYDPQDFDINLFKNLLTPIELTAFNESLNDIPMAVEFNALKEKIKTDATHRKLYTEFLAHRAETWYENLILYLSDNDDAFNGNFTNEYIDGLNQKIHALGEEIKTIDATNLENLAKKQESKQNLSDVLENIDLYTQMICWTTNLKNQIESNIDELLTVFTKFRADALKERAKKKEKANAELARQNKIAEEEKAKAAAEKERKKEEERQMRLLEAQKPRPSRTAAAAAKPAGKGGKHTTRRKLRKNLKRRRQSKRQYREHN